MPQFVITAVGQDRPGLVHQLTGILLAVGANVADSRMINLRGQFALILLAEVVHDKAEPLSASLVGPARKLGMTISVTQTPNPAVVAEDNTSGIRQGHTAPKTDTNSGVPYRLRTHAMDRPGIVHRIAHLLHARGVNIEELQTRLEPRSYGGTPVFTLDQRMTIPPNVSIDELRDELDALCDSLDCKVDLAPE